MLQTDSSKVDAFVQPNGSLEFLSLREIGWLSDKTLCGCYDKFRCCALAALNSGAETDDSRDVLDQYADFEIEVIKEPRGVGLKVINAPARAFVDGEMIEGIREHLFSVLRDIVYTQYLILDDGRFDLSKSEHITDSVFHILKNATVFQSNNQPDLIVCWGGHSVSRAEYEYSKDVGYMFGLRKLNICTGCGHGVMKGPMKGAALGHAKQRSSGGRYIGITEPGIIAAEAPNAMVNALVIMPDIEKRLEAFVRLGHGVVVFPGGVGTTEEILYVLSILLHPDNRDIKFPLLLTGPESSRQYFEDMDQFLRITLGDEVSQLYQIVIGDPVEASRAMYDNLKTVQTSRLESKDAFYFNWNLQIQQQLQTPFVPTHDNMAQLQLNRDQPAHQLAANMRCAFSGIVAGNVKQEGIKAVQQHGPFLIHGDREILQHMQQLLDSFIKQRRMTLAENYKPSYQLVID
ncbi:MAG: nucleotide 5'-monophosphate nucleosidase PpnN [Gammaproteobacteria bacterium]|nr:nucleotide 5'-monophosphate nucleosidase PpnN [Gammaproteobacteria bacterium]